MVAEVRLIKTGMDIGTANFRYSVEERPRPDGTTGGTIEAAISLIEELGGKVVKVLFLMELAGLKGRERLKDYDVESVICYEGK